MSTNIVLIVVGVVVLVLGLIKLSSGQSGGFSLRNIGINIGSTSIQKNEAGNMTSAKTGKTDWVGLATTAIGLVTALVGIFKS